ncbi:pyridoxal phosphate-dependent aminotransferase [Frigidibacter sp. ROC022]|uniref:pyridoxal phosphate-dependent aminotransferase n=1 Tax=Frigidibacter sp. ROC022 TaxID=2971796 RepID=UPI00215B744D|nr:aminotransferase class I/II-fold pyridoxal phosphate-dependent enzyme [Frigidibacter sp. ROC022]
MRNSRRGEVDPFIVMDVLRAARQAEAAGRRIAHLEIGQPGFPAPKGALAALGEAMQSGALGYTEALGLPALRARIARLYRDRYGIELNPERVIVTAGSSAGFLLAFTALFDAGEKVGLGLPGYPSYRHILKALSLEPVGIETSAQTRYQPVPEELPEGLAGLIVASPGNPSGTMLDRDALGGLLDWAAANGTAFVSDEIYHGIDYGFRPVSALELTDDAWVINSFSKYWSMTGWRVGWMVVPEAQVRRVERLAQNLFICAPHASQVAALAALDCDDEAQANLAVYAANREMLLDRLPGMGFDRIAPPDGAFYIYADVSEMTRDSRAFAAEILDRADVALTPGLDFDPGRGARFLRFSYAAGTEEIAEGLDRLERFLGR